MSESTQHSPLETSAFEEVVQEAINFWKVPSIAIGIVNGEETYARGYGLAELPDTAATPETLYYAGSTTKAFTAAAVSLLIDDHEKNPVLDWDTPISQLVPEDFVLQDEYWTRNMTLEDALSHRTGMPRHEKSYGGKGWHPKDMSRCLRDLPLTAEPRTKFQYCNLMYATVSHVIEVLGGLPLGQFLRQRIWKPLGMSSTCFTLEEAQNSDKYLAHGYQWDEQSGRHEVTAWMNMPESSGAGNMITNVLDLTRWIRMMIQQREPLSKSGHAELVRPRIPTGIDTAPYMSTIMYALGWRISTYHGEPFVFHGGGITGFGAKVFFFPGLNWGCAMLANTAGTSNKVQEELTWRLVDNLLGIPESKRTDWRQRNLQDLQEADGLKRNAKDRLFPWLIQRQPPACPLKNYAGTYYNAGYRDVTVCYQDGRLYAKVSDRTWPYALEFEQVTREQFVAYIRSQDSDEPPATAAEFDVDTDGVVKRLGIVMDMQMGSRKTWFDRQD